MDTIILLVQPGVWSTEYGVQEYIALDTTIIKHKLVYVLLEFLRNCVEVVFYTVDSVIRTR